MLVGHAHPTVLPWTNHRLISTASTGRRKDGNESNIDHNEDERYVTDMISHSQRKRFIQFLQKAHRDKSNNNKTSQSPRLPSHPHMITASPEILDMITRYLVGVVCPLSWQNKWRDSGSLRSFVDTLVTYAAPIMTLLIQPTAFIKFQKLTQQCQTIQYGAHHLQKMDLFFPNGDCELAKGLLFFVVSLVGHSVEDVIFVSVCMV